MSDVVHRSHYTTMPLHLLTSSIMEEATTGQACQELFMKEEIL